MMKFSCLIFILLAGCGRQTEEIKEQRAIKTEGKVMDSFIDSKAKNTIQKDGQLANVGFQEDREQRLLLNIPEIDKLYNEDVVLSSVTAIEVVFYADSVPVNPENIRLAPVTKKWGPFVNWNFHIFLDGTT